MSRKTKIMEIFSFSFRENVVKFSCFDEKITMILVSFAVGKVVILLHLSNEKYILRFICRQKVYSLWTKCLRCFCSPWKNQNQSQAVDSLIVP